jgi:transposase InsO family protein
VLVHDRAQRPGVLYTDHGSDFTSRHLEQVMADLRIRPVFSLPGQPRGRGKIERYMDSVNQMCLAALLGPRLCEGRNARSFSALRARCSAAQ